MINTDKKTYKAAFVFKIEFVTNLITAKINKNSIAFLDLIEIN